MKKTLISLVFLCVLIPSASAQWYLFPGSPQQKKEKAAQDNIQKELDRIHSGGASQETQSQVADPKKSEAQDQSQAKESSSEPWTFRPKYGTEDDNIAEQPDTLAQEGQIVDEFIFDIPETINLALLLPLKSVVSPSSNFMDYYSGALMATRDLGNKGMKIDLNVFDTTDPGARITDAGLASADIIIGPVSADELAKTLERCPEDKFIVSPIEPKARALADSSRIIQVPAVSEAQVDDLIDWISSDMQPSDKLLVVKDATAAAGGESDELLAKLSETGIQYSVIDSPKFDGFDLLQGTLRVLVISEKDSFLCGSVNAIAKLGASKGNVILYSTSKLRSLEGINAEALFNAQCHMVSSYFIDYTDARIKDFVLSYRALFGAEPSSFAFHGYDSISYFVSMCAEYGRQWYKKLPEKSWKGLQADFKFEDTDTVGKVNSAVRRIVYRQDLSIVLQ